jgi:hypothetical protein
MCYQHIIYCNCYYSHSKERKRKDVAYLRAVEITLSVSSTLHLTYLKRQNNITLIYCNGFGRVARQQLCKHCPARNNRWDCVFYVVRATPSAANGPMNSQSDTWHVFSVWSAPCNNRGAVFSVRGPYREDMRDYGNTNWLNLSSEVPGNSSEERRRMWRYMCCSTSILGVCI